MDEPGNVHLSGYTRSTNLQVTAGAIQVDGRRKATFVKLSTDFSRLLYTTHVGGSKRDDSRTGFLGAEGSWYLAGETASSHWPM